MGDPRRDHGRPARHHGSPCPEHWSGGIRGALLLRGVDGGRATSALPDGSGRQSSLAVPPLEQVTQPRPQGQSWKEKYTWDTAPRWDRQAMEAGAYARLWNTAVARKIVSNPFIESTGESLKLNLPKGARPEMEFEWKVPEAWNAFERNRARAYCIPYTALVAMV